MHIWWTTAVLTECIASLVMKAYFKLYGALELTCFYFFLASVAYYLTHATYYLARDLLSCTCDLPYLARAR